MPEKTYRLVLENRLPDGADKAAVTAVLCKYLKLDPQRALLFGRGEILLASGVDYWNAQEFETTIKKTGAACRIEEETAKEPQAAGQDETPLDSCLNCGWKPIDATPVRRGSLCPRCGMEIGASAANPSTGQQPETSLYKSPYLSDGELYALKKQKITALLKKAAPLLVIIVIALAFAHFNKNGGTAANDPVNPLKEIKGPPPFSFPQLNTDIAKHRVALPADAAHDYNWYVKVYVAPCKNNNWPFEKTLLDTEETALNTQAHNMGGDTIRFLLDSVCRRNELAAQKLISPAAAEKLSKFIAAAGMPDQPHGLPFGTTSWADLQSSVFHCPADDSRSVITRLRPDIKPLEARPDEEISYLLHIYLLENIHHNSHSAFTADLALLINEYPNMVPDREKALAFVKTGAMHVQVSDQSFELAMEQYPGAVVIVDQKGFREVVKNFPQAQEPPKK